jgi:hypothetical protein
MLQYIASGGDLHAPAGAFAVTDTPASMEQLPTPRGRLPGYQPMQAKRFTGYPPMLSRHHNAIASQHTVVFGRLTCPG